MSATPAISIITPTWNRRELLLQAMDSVQVQDLPDWEHVIVDDGSTDGTAELVADRASSDPRIRWIQRAGDKAGASVCRNIGWRAARASLIIFLDSDDLLDPDCLSLRVKAMTRNQDLAFSVFRTGVFKEAPGDLKRELSAEVVGDDLLQFLFFEIPWQTSASVWRRPVLEELDGFDEALPSWQDVDLHIRAIAGAFKYLRYRRIDHHMRWHWEDTKVSIMQRRSPDHLRAAPDILKKFEIVVRKGPGMNWSRQRALCSLYFMVAEFWVQAGCAGEALRAWRMARARGLSTGMLQRSGAVLLVLESLFGSRPLVMKIVHKWKGLMRLRTNAELVSP